MRIQRDGWPSLRLGCTELYAHIVPDEDGVHILRRIQAGTEWNEAGLPAVLACMHSVLHRPTPSGTVCAGGYALYRLVCTGVGMDALLQDAYNAHTVQDSGFTFAPLFLLLFVLYVWFNSKTVRFTPSKKSIGKNRVHDGSDVYKTGWLRVAREVPSVFLPSPLSSRSSATKMMNHGLNPMMEEGDMEVTWRHQRPVLFFAVLKHGNLFLYDKENRLDVKHVIVLSRYHVSIWPHDAPDGELFIRKNAICLTEYMPLSTTKTHLSDSTLHNPINTDTSSGQELNAPSDTKLHRVASNLSCSSTISSSNLLNIENISNACDTNSGNSVSPDHTTSSRSHYSKNTIPSNCLSKRRTIVVVGDDHVGKSSLITSLVKINIDDKALTDSQYVVPPVSVPDMYSNMNTIIVDTSSDPADRPVLIKELRKANVICLVYADSYSGERISLFWLPFFRSLGVNLPVVLCANKSDNLEADGSQIIEEEMLPIMKEFKEVESCIRSSGKFHRNVNEVFYLCQRAVTHPIAPLFNAKEHLVQMKGCPLF
ncbi:hypothetical protein PCK1_000774 [Pneumocystis canis]|nr:hypothetical protein PCK1_000774 [Pneumocystis canis]